MAKFKGGRLRIDITDPDEAQQFLNGCILAKQNNSSEYFPQLVAGINSIMEPYTQALMAEAQAGVGPSAKVKVE